MEEVDSILIHTLKQIGCDVNSNISQFSPIQIIKCVTRCLELIGPELEIPAYDGNISMSARYKVASDIAQSVKDLGFKDEIGCQSFLYPTEEETRKLLIFMMEKLPKDIDSDVGDQIETLLSKIAQDSDETNIFAGTNGIEVGGIRLPLSVDINKLPKETLRFYASHLAELSFAKQKEKFKKSTPELPQPALVKRQLSTEDDDFGDPDEYLTNVDKPDELPDTPQLKVEKPPVLPKPKPPLKEKPYITITNKVKESEDENKDDSVVLEEFTRLANNINLMQQETKARALQIKSAEKQLNLLNQKFSKFEDDIEKLKNEIEQKEKLLLRQRKTKALLSGSEDALEKVRSAVEAQVEKLIQLAQKWEKHRGPLVDEIQTRLANENGDGVGKKEQIRYLKVKLKEMGQEARSKEQLQAHLVQEYEKMPKDMNRSAYTKRICEIIRNIKKQKKEITNVLTDTKAIQKDINTLSGRLDRTFAVADELIFKDAEKDKNVAQSYKLLVTIHSDFSKLIKILEEIGNSKRFARDLEDKLELEKGKNIIEKLERLKVDLSLMKHENQVLHAKLRGPALIASKKI